MTEDKPQLKIPRKSFIFIVFEPCDSYKEDACKKHCSYFKRPQENNVLFGNFCLGQHTCSNI